MASKFQAAPATPQLQAANTCVKKHNPIESLQLHRTHIGFSTLLLTGFCRFLFSGADKVIRVWHPLIFTRPTGVVRGRFRVRGRFEEEPPTPPLALLTFTSGQGVSFIISNRIPIQSELIGLQANIFSRAGILKLLVISVKSYLFRSLA